MSKKIQTTFTKPEKSKYTAFRCPVDLLEKAIALIEKDSKGPK